ncbi:exosome complex component CSL4 isoform X2 [Microtus oregoni]|uniref:exosome complex component CSL4 isoform X2 n=1 Tax=Microtus oregoni TaxID=111838 RepID=UPI001BB12515|nr:exosome complex component CSL4 isoform X2 [Microtus oregoni]
MAPPVRYCIPGERLCNLEEGSPGSGTYTRHGYIFSSLAGCLTKTSENGALPVVSVMRETESQLLPDVGAVVTCKVSSINSRFAKVHILYVGSTPLKNAFRGTIRKEDIRATEKDKVEDWWFGCLFLLKFTRVSAQVSRWFPSAGVRCSAPRPTQKNSGKWPGYSLSSYKPKHTSPQRRSHLFPRVPV